MTKSGKFRTLLLVVGLITVIHCKTQWTLVRDFSYQDVYSTENRITTQSDRTMTHCAVECHVTHGCVAIGYGVRTHACHMYSTDLANLYDGGIVKSPDEIDYYKVTCNGGEGFVYLKEFDLCLRMFDVQLTWQDADEMCQMIGTHLLVIKTQEQLDTLAGFFPYYTNNHYWLGGYRWDQFSDDWYWPTGEIINGSTGGQLWLPGKPGNFARCMSMQYTSDGEFGLRDRNCTNERRFFCQTY